MYQLLRRATLLRRTALISASALALAVAPLASMPAANAVSYHHIYNHNGKCLDMTNGSKSRGTQVQIWSCNANLQQYWTLKSIVYQPTGTDGVLIINKNSGMCLSILNDSRTPPAAVIQWPCNNSGGDPWEDWIQNCSTGINNYCYLLNIGMSSFTGCCDMHPSGNGSSDGLKVYANIPDGNYAYFWTRTVVG
jgi:hypothetical protein